MHKDLEFRISNLEFCDLPQLPLALHLIGYLLETQLFQRIPFGPAAASVPAFKFVVLRLPFLEFRLVQNPALGVGVCPFPILINGQVIRRFGGDAINVSAMYLHVTMSALQHPNRPVQIPYLSSNLDTVCK